VGPRTRPSTGRCGSAGAGAWRPCGRLAGSDRHIWFDWGSPSHRRPGTADLSRPGQWALPDGGGRPCPAAPGREIHGSLCSPPASSRPRPREAAGQDGISRAHGRRGPAPTARSRARGASTGRPIPQPAHQARVAPSPGLAAGSSTPPITRRTQNRSSLPGGTFPSSGPGPARVTHGSDRRCQGWVLQTGSAAGRGEVPGGRLEPRLLAGPAASRLERGIPDGDRNQPPVARTAGRRGARGPAAPAVRATACPGGGRATACPGGGRGGGPAVATPHANS